MKWLHPCLLLTASCSTASGDAGLASAQTAAEHAADGTHVLHVDIPDRDHDRQIMDIHPARDAERLEDRNYTIVPASTSSSMCHRIVSHPEPGQRLRQQELHDTFIDVLNFLDRIATGGLPVAPSRATV
jgi:hypothetical protein